MEGAQAKKDKDFLKAYCKSLLGIDSLKDLLINVIDGGQASTTDGLRRF